MSFEEALFKNSYLLAEGSILERLSREFNLEIDPNILHASLVYSNKGREVLKDIYNQYIDVGYKNNIPIVNFTPTWRANFERLKAAGMNNLDVNGDCYRFLSTIREQYGEYSSNILIGGLIGCKGDAYKSEEALSPEEAYDFHQYQIKALANAGVDFLIAETLPSVQEAIGIAKAMSEENCEYIISFVIRPDGTVLDGTKIEDAINKIDSIVSPKPICSSLRTSNSILSER